MDSRRELFIETDVWDVAKKAASLGERVSAARKIKGWNQSRLAKEMSLSRATISDWEKNIIKELKVENLIKLSDLTDTNIRWLATGEGTPVRRFIKDGEEAELIDIFRDLSTPNRQVLLTTAIALRSSEPTPGTKRNPFKKPAA